VGKWLSISQPANLWSCLLRLKSSYLDASLLDADLLDPCTDGPATSHKHAQKCMTHLHVLPGLKL
jgi:hypothetical protein